MRFQWRTVDSLCICRGKHRSSGVIKLNKWDYFSWSGKIIAMDIEPGRTKKFAPIHPGEILLEEFLKPLGVSQYRLAHDIGVPPRRINEIVHGKRAVSADTALRLSRYFGLSERFWINLQAHYDLEVEKDRLAGRLEREVRVLANSPAV